MELRQLRYFIAVAEEGHITRAAERLGMQQPPLSVQIKSLENEIGVALFTRHARGVELTPGGRVLLDAARALFTGLERTREQVVRTAQGLEGKLCVGFSGSVAAHSFSSDVIRHFRRAYPQVALQLKETNAPELTELTARGDIDVTMLRIPPLHRPGFIFDQLFDEEMVLALPRNHKLLRKHGARKDLRISLRELAAEKFVFNRRPGPLGMYANLVRACQRVGFMPHIAAEVDHMGSVINLVAAEVGLAVVPASMRGVHGDDVVYCRLRDAADVNAPVTLVYLESNHNPAAANFLGIARKRATAYKRGRKR